ncbi:PilX N-terminal domain-containing pilus assembly protein [Thiocapsa sp.]|uniref:pilus assembly PilX family protein n=1 Tax=Thiocapsa sp. TaxID=2024551 RepID=UPI0025EB1724|nr:PilX N-terminal domain-containing pilus assembly protein [Thiocapsa sp.]
MRTHLNRSEDRGIRQQKGVVLVVALMFTLVMSIVGVTAMQSTIMQERMAGNARDRNLAFQAAEAALRAGEDASIGGGPAADTMLADPAGWDGETPEPTGSVKDFDPQLAADPVYYADPPRQVRVGITLPPRWRYAYPVIARGEGGTHTAIVVLQSVLEPP